MACFSCAKEMEEISSVTSVASGDPVQIVATIDNTKIACGEDGKLSWTATDKIGLMVVGTDSSSDINLDFSTDEEMCNYNVFSRSEAGSVLDGTVYAYYPYVEYNNPDIAYDACIPNKDLHVNADSTWICLASGQHQSQANAMEFGNYFTMIAGPAAIKDGVIEPLSFSPLASVISFDIYDSSAKYASEQVRSVIATVVNDDDNPLTGGYKYSFVKGEFDYTSSGRRAAACVVLDTPFNVPAASGSGLVYMAVLPGTRTLKITVNTDCGSHVFNMSAPVVSQVCKKGKILLNLANEKVEHYLLYQHYDLLNWGGDLMYQKTAVGSYWLPLCDDTGKGKVAIASMTGEEPYKFLSSDYNCDGTVPFTSLPEKVLAEHCLDGWAYSKIYEHPGYVKGGSSSAGYSITTPALKGVGETPQTVKFSFKVVHRYGCTDKLVVTVNGAGTIDGKTVKTIDIPVPAAYTDVPGCITTQELYIEGATSGTSVTIKNEGTYANKARTNFDDFEAVIGVAPVKDVTTTFRYVASAAVVPSSTAAWGSGISYDEAESSFENGQGKMVFKGEVTSIPANAISSAALRSINFQSAVTSIAAGAFSGCTALESVVLKNETPCALASGAFSGCSVSAVYVPASAIEACKGSSDWSAYTSLLKSISDIVIFKDVPKTWISEETFGNATEVRVDKLYNDHTLVPEAIFNKVDSIYRFDTSAAPYVYLEPSNVFGDARFFLGRAYNDGACLGSAEVRGTYAFKDIAGPFDAEIVLRAANRETYANKIFIRYVDESGTTNEYGFDLEALASADWKTGTWVFKDCTATLENYSSDCKVIVANKNYQSKAARCAFYSIEIKAK